jgi:hypothetical protein
MVIQTRLICIKKYRERLLDITTTVTQARSRVSAATNNAREHAAAAAEHEKHITDAVAVTQRDATGAVNQEHGLFRLRG